MCSLKAVNDTYLRKQNLLINRIIFNLITRHHDLIPINLISSMMQNLDFYFFKPHRLRTHLEMSWFSLIPCVRLHTDSFL